MATPSTILATPSRLHATAGAKMAFGSLAPCPITLATRPRVPLCADTVALIDKNYRAYLAFTGPDRPLL